MLAELSIRNVAIIEQLQLSFSSGLNLLTGETGAGKSIIIDSLALATGGRASNELIRTGEEEASVEALFLVKGRDDIAGFLGQAGFITDDELLIKRIIAKSGRNRCFINGSIATQSQLAELGRRLVTIHGQHESQELLKPENHLQLLDSFAGSHKLRQQFQQQFEGWQALNEQLNSYDRDELDAARQLDLLSFQAQELATADLKSGEEDELVSRQQLLASAEKLSMLTGNAFERLYGDDDAVLAALKKISSAITEAATIDQRLAPMAKALDESYLQIEDAALELRSYVGQIEFDQEGLRLLDERLDLINRLKKKYGMDLEGLISLRNELDVRLEQLRDRSCSREELSVRTEAAKAQMTELGQQLTAARTKAALKLSKVLADEAHQLAMKHAVVLVEVAPLETPRQSGFDRIEFLFSPNPGETPRPLGRVASGGELSRLMLAFKQVLPEGEAPTMVFDEVDAGVGGAVAGVIGRKLDNVAKGQQVFCITHLPQVAAFASHHLKVEKKVENGRTVTSVRELDQQARVEEIARMLAGETITEAARKHAEELISQRG